ncbi:lysophospholipid acyltransferase family protein [Ottowia testudinis]|uniref:1-acyl-sn-glycerol-3-phosphate acyltransferase n=1 Tax=Ottowia testudinis TaxID=2816950 RepID=A0A975CG24_9BURK|nr:lysophospholipid acyltransferase family protein [Ottowia testudinis]QTD44904.1 1-acyl-sn-glycerol-3-phosphate acyltransferase [Ottowia testudinis]
MSEHLPVPIQAPDSPAKVRILARRAAAWCTGQAIIGFARLLTGVRALLAPGASLQAVPTLYFANHSSHGDFVLLWATLPPELRDNTRPVAGEDYWLASRLRRFIGHDVFNALMIRRQPATADAPEAPADPVAQMVRALEAGSSLIMFPEGTRNTTDAVMLPLKSGLFHLARQCPQARLVPVWIENLRRVLPKGELLPIPLACSVRYGAPIVLGADEDKAAFLARARQAMLDLRPDHQRQAEHGDAAQEEAA